MPGRVFSFEVVVAVVPVCVGCQIWHVEKEVEVKTINERLDTKDIVSLTKFLLNPSQPSLF